MKKRHHNRTDNRITTSRDQEASSPNTTKRTPEPTRDNADRGEPPKIGYRKPPKHGQFKKGQCGNPHGRPRKPQPEPGVSLLQSFIEMGLQEQEFRDPDGRTQKMTPRAALCQKIWSDGTKNIKTALAIIELHRSEIVEGRERHKLSSEDEAILARMIDRYGRYDTNDTNTNNVPPRDQSESDDE